MDNKFTILWLDNDAIVTFGGDISFHDIMQANGLIYGNIKFDRMKFQIFDYSQIKSIDLTYDIAEIIAKLDIAATVWNKKVKVATVTSDKNIRKLIESYNKKMESSFWAAKTFNKIDDAKQWCIE